MINIQQTLGVLNTVASLSSKTLKLGHLELFIDTEGLVLALNLMVSGVIKDPIIRFNMKPSVDTMKEIREFQAKGAIGIPMDTLRLLHYMHNPLRMGLGRHEVYKLLEDRDLLQDVYSILGGSDEFSCIVCSETLEEDTKLCNHCLDTLKQFEEFRSVDSFTTTLGYINFPRMVTLTDSTSHKVVLNNYSLEIRGKDLVFTRVKSFQAQLPIREYHKALIHSAKHKV